MAISGAESQENVKRHVLAVIFGLNCAWLCLQFHLRFRLTLVLSLASIRSLQDGLRSWRSPSRLGLDPADPAIDEVEPVTAAAAAAIEADVETAVMEDAEDDPENSHSQRGRFEVAWPPGRNLPLEGCCIETDGSVDEVTTVVVLLDPMPIPEDGCWLATSCWSSEVLAWFSCCCFFLTNCSADLRSSRVTPWVDLLVSRTLFAWAFRWVSDSSSLTGGTNDLEKRKQTG